MPPKTRADKSAKAEANLWSDRKVVVILTLTGLTILGLTFYGFSRWANLYLPAPHIHSLTDRIVWTLRHQVLGALTVVWSVLHVALNRALTAAINPLSGHDSAVDKANRILSNTLEQFVLNAFNQLVLSTYLSESNLRLIPLLTAYFVIGRIAFWIGYQIGPKYRALGFSLTFMPTLAITGLNVYFLLTTNVNYLFDGGKPFGRI